MRLIQPLLEPTGNDRAGRVDQAFQFVQMFFGEVWGYVFRGGTDQYGSFLRGFDRNKRGYGWVSFFGCWLKLGGSRFRR